VAVWDPGPEEGRPRSHVPLEVHAFDSRTYILRENLAVTWEAPIMYLLVGNTRALLIDTGDVVDPRRMPLASTVLSLLPGKGEARLPLLVMHTHGHLDHRLGDRQFDHQPRVEVVPADLPSLKLRFGLADWPEGAASVDLGDRIIDLLPSPGHHPAHIVFYDRHSGLLFSGDFLLPGRLLVEDLAAYRDSARRVAEFVKERPVSQVLGAHIEKNRQGGLFPWRSSHHPEESPLALTKADVLSLPAALQAFNGFYTESGPYVIENSLHILIAAVGVSLALLLGTGGLMYHFIRRRGRRRLGRPRLG
jgi:glyoxylase-like metal-dependent hydrolase (beta-lactamase superfamily II)